MNSLLVEAVAAYSRRVLPTLLEGGGATSPLAPWMLAALLAPAASGETVREIEADLGLPAELAAAEAEALLVDGPAALRSAVAFWRRPELASAELAHFEVGLPAGAATGPVPSQAVADAWTREATLGLVERFPVSLDPLVAATLAAAIATRVSWREPLAVRPAPGNAFGLAEMLSATPMGVFESAAGLVAMARNRSREDEAVTVYSFIADPAVSKGDLAVAALELLAGQRGGWALPLRLESLPVHGHAWEIAEGSEDTALVPAFEERTEGLGIGSLAGIGPAREAFFRLIAGALPAGVPPDRVEAAMSAVARYDRLGFEAAAVAAVAFRFAALADEPVRRPVIHLHFGRPHLAIAVSRDERYRGLPLFAAWVERGVREPERTPPPGSEAPLPASAAPRKRVSLR